MEDGKVFTVNVALYIKCSEHHQCEKFVTPLHRMMSFKIPVSKGDTLDGLVAKFGVPRRILIAANSGVVSLLGSRVLA